MPLSDFYSYFKLSPDPDNLFSKSENVGYMFGCIFGIPFAYWAPRRLFPYLKRACSSKLPETAKMAFIITPNVHQSKLKVAIACNRGIVAACQRGRLPHISHWAGVGMQEVWMKSDRPVSFSLCKDINECENIKKNASKSGLVTHWVNAKKGSGEFLESKTPQVLVIGPGPDEVIDKLTANLSKI